MVTIQLDIECGKYACLKSCCTEDSLAEIWRLMRSVGEADLYNLSRMLCGCSLSTSSGSGLKEGGAGSTPQLPLAGPAVSCEDKALEWCCNHRGGFETLRSISLGLATVIIFTPIFGPMAVLFQDILNSCSDDGKRLQRDSRVVNQIVARLCTLRKTLELARKLPLDGVVNAAILAIVTLITPLLELMADCCKGFTSNKNDLPQLPTAAQLIAYYEQNGITDYIVPADLDSATGDPTTTLT